MVFTGKCMTRFDLLPNYHPDHESLLRKSCSWLSSPGSSGSHIWEIIDQFQGSTPQVEPVPMAPRKWINDFLALSSANIRTDLQQSPFYGKALEDANAHIQHLMEIYITFTIWGITQDTVHLRLFPFSLWEKEKQWFYTNKEDVSTWEKCSNAFLAKFFSLGQTNSL
jgi:hypothetical protein